MYALRITWRKWFKFGLKFIHIWRCESANSQSSLYVFAIFNVKPDLTAILQELNSVHRNIKFSYEPETDGTLHFLDVNVHYNNGKFLTTTYSKPTNTGLYTLWSSFTPKLYKSNLFICLLQRSYRICTNWASFISEIESLQNTFVKIGYPRNFVLNISKKLYR